ncbi:uncharacterized protein PHALS_02988 [Plasmopara halstedii]|uniref:Uncharacterized protein n=1 Tax=Plasmopara halstedii TaxID=4781 RepID=A0A0P1A879_PLAHL|nr:uncharacterized protein PHALS_02988 [Plasmopara halstedii]CEG36438.1 hypothetical protein PHALS_02988 [Plasmopara halstedii]|eukprot:XP_024572807.1 hypothetical protein PHALS_02988 [Plasmopara halstedii]
MRFLSLQAQLKRDIRDSSSTSLSESLSQEQLEIAIDQGRHSFIANTNIVHYNESSNIFWIAKEP